MLTHRLAALGLAAALLHLNVIRADSACATHEHQPQASAPAEVAGHHDHAAMMAHETPAPVDHSNCDAPAQRDCCQAVTTCSFALDASAPAEIESDAAFVSEPAEAPVGRLLSRVTPPEPPPPRA